MRVMMPIYAYRCNECGYSQDVLQKISDPALTVCPSCGKSTFSKQVTAAGFQLKGSGWYATDFKNSSTAPVSSEFKSTESGTAETSAKAPTDSPPSTSNSPTKDLRAK